MKNDNTIIHPICSQPLEAFECDNCYSHHAYYEGLRASNADRITSKELTDWEAEKELRKNKRQANYVNEKKERNLAEWQARRHVCHSRLDPAMLADSARRVHEKSKALRKYACDICDMALPRLTFQARGEPPTFSAAAACSWHSRYCGWRAVRSRG
jgi:hypothetical protein